MYYYYEVAEGVMGLRTSGDRNVNENECEVMTFSTSALARVLKVIAHEFSLTFQITTSAESHCN